LKTAQAESSISTSETKSRLEEAEIRAHALACAEVRSSADRLVLRHSVFLERGQISRANAIAEGITLLLQKSQ
jgi:hypothetical protein